MVFNTSNIKRKFKYKSTVSAPSSSSPTPTAYKSAGQPKTPSPKQPYQGPPQQVKKGKGKRNYNNIQTDLPTTLEQAVNSDKLIATPKSKNFFDKLSSLNIAFKPAYGSTPPTESSSSIDGIPRSLDQAVTSGKLVTDKGDIDGRWFDQALINLPSNIDNWWERATMPTKERNALEEDGRYPLDVDASGVTSTDQNMQKEPITKYSAEQFPLYYGAPSKQNTVTDGGVDQGMVKHTGYADLDTTNATLNKQNTVKNTTYIPGVTKAMGTSSNESMKLFSNGSTKSSSISDSINFQNNSRVHTNMIKEWQAGYLKNANVSTDQRGASNWLNLQLGKIDSMQGTDKNKKMFKKDLQGRFDGLFMNKSAPFQSPQTLKHNNISDGMTRQQERKEAKRLQAVQARDGYFNSSSVNNWMPSTVVPPQGQPDKKVTPAGNIQKMNLLSDFATGNF